MKTDDFLKYQAQTTPHPLQMTVSKASGSYIYDDQNQAHLDFVAGVSACSLGHSHPSVVKAIKDQVDSYMHVMVYGEYALKPAVDYSKLLADLLPKPLNCTYLVNSGTEAIEGSLKLSRRVTGRSQIIAAKNAYHGNTMGSLSLMGKAENKKPFEPLIGDVDFIEFNSEEDLLQITSKTAAVILETIQGGAGFIIPQNNYLKKVKERCSEVGALLILDEIQPGFGRTGSLFAFEQFDCIPDILVVGKGMCSGLPGGAFIASFEHMQLLSDNPKLGHITTFGGNPVIAAAAHATLKELTQNNNQLILDTLKKEQLIREKLQHPLIRSIRGMGLMLALLFENEEIANYLILEATQKNLILFWLLFEKKAARITPPLTISEEELIEGCDIILSILDTYRS